MVEIALTKSGFGYATADGRWVVRKVPMGGGITGWVGGRGWSEGHTEFEVTDTHGLAQLSTLGPRHSKIVQRLYEARALIAAHTR